MDDIEDGELPSSPEHEQTYTPLVRPDSISQRPLSSGGGCASRNSFDGSSSNRFQDDDDNEADHPLGLAGPSSGDDDSDSDLESRRPSRKMKRMSDPRMDTVKSSSSVGGGSMFNAMAAQWQEGRAAKGLPTRTRKNNVWGSILQEETLTSEMTGIGVGRSMNDVESDRGAETYDYVAAAEAKERERSEANNVARNELDNELEGYWKRTIDDDDDDQEDSRRSEAITAGRKRSVKERLGQVKTSGRSSSPDEDSWDTMSIPPPGMPRNISDLNPIVVESLEQEMDDEEGEEDKAARLGDELAAKLSEPKTDLMIGVVEMVGPEVCVELFKKTQDIESRGGMMIKNGERRRTPGGVFLQLLRDMGADESETRVNSKDVKLFFAQSNRDYQASKQKVAKRLRKGRSASEDFKSELEAFKKFNDKTKTKKSKTPPDVGSSSGDADLKPLPDILTCISQRMRAKEKSSSARSLDSNESTSVAASATTSTATATAKKPEVFVEPEAPPNSVERTDDHRAIVYDDDDFLNTECETEDIELF